MRGHLNHIIRKQNEHTWNIDIKLTFIHTESPLLFSRQVSWVSFKLKNMF